MPTCPNCGEILMNGNPYCSHCGTALRWDNYDYDVTRKSRPIEIVRNNVPINSFFSCLYEFNINATTINSIKRDLNVSKAKNTIVNIGQEFPNANLDITFIRQNKYFKTVDSLKYNQFPNKIDEHYFRSDFTKLKNTDWFKNTIKQKENEIGLKFYDCGGGYDAKWDWNNSTFELKEGCEVIAHFIQDNYYYRGFVVDFKNHRLKNESKEYERATPYDLIENASTAKEEVLDFRVENIELTADKMELELWEGTNAKAYLTDINGNPVPNALVYWSTSENQDIGTSRTNSKGIALKRILKVSKNLTVRVKCGLVVDNITFE